MNFVRYADPAAWRARIAGWLQADPAGGSLLVSVAERSAAGGWCGLVEHAGEPVLALAQTPPWPAVVASPLPADAAVAQAALAGLGEHGLALSGVNGPGPWARALAAASGRAVRETMNLRLHLLRGPPQCPHPPPGAARPWREAELPLWLAWEAAFEQDLEPGQRLPPRSVEWQRTLLQQSLLWEDDGPRAMARAVRPLLGGWCLAGVYTPPEHRRHGYAGAVVHALCARLLAQGATYLALYTDLANPTSNRLYHAIGFVPAGDYVRLLWEPDAPPTTKPPAARP